MARHRIGVPYPASRVQRKGNDICIIRTCPACGVEIREEVDQHGELETNNYGRHYVKVHEKEEE